MPEDSLKNRIKTWDYPQLSKSYLSLTKKLSDPKNKNSIELLLERISLIRNEWESRKEGEGPEYYFISEGLLSVMGYKVGINGLKPETRQKILADVIEGPIPLVGDKGYMSEWGEDGSEDRIRKTANCLYGFSTGKAHATHSQAIKDWEEDLVWLQKNYQ